jgi:hypothetical protein
MTKYKTPQIRDDYNRVGGEYSTPENLLLKLFVKIIDDITTMTRHGDITITSYIRKDNPHSLHFYGRAVDVRVKDKSLAWYMAMEHAVHLFHLLNPRFRIQIHLNQYNTIHKHIHIEIRDEK